LPPSLASFARSFGWNHDAAGFDLADVRSGRGAALAKPEVEAAYEDHDREQIEDRMVDYMRRASATGEPWSHVSRHLLGLRNGQAGARRWRQVWSDHRLKNDAPAAVSAQARAAFSPELV